MAREVSRRVVIGAAAALTLTACGKRENTAEPLTPTAKAYVHNLQLSAVTMKATANYAGQTVTEIEGKVANHGDRVIHAASITCVFYDFNGQVVKRERVPIIKENLPPGVTRAFRLPFDDIPESWNNQMPQLVIARIEFA